MSNRPNLLLDLDATLISAQATEDYMGKESKFKKLRRRAKKFKVYDMDGFYMVFERPHLQKFLDYAFKNFNVSVWTAASQSYALFIVEKIVIAGKANRVLDYVFFSYHCEVSKKMKGGSKDLSMLWDEYKLKCPNGGLYGAHNTVILDDFDEVADTQPHNCVSADFFEASDEGSEKDDFLVRVIPILDKLQSTVISAKPGSDVRLVAMDNDEDSTTDEDDTSSDDESEDSPTFEIDEVSDVEL